MSDGGYFDHVRCQNCRSAIDPEKLQARVGPGGVAQCPYCNGPIQLGDMFGLKAQYAEDDEPELSLDDLSSDSRDRPVWTGYGGTAPDPMKGMAPPPSRFSRGGVRPGQQQPPPQQPRGHQSRRSAPREEPQENWRGGRGQVVRVGNDDDDDEIGGTSALDIMKRMKKR